MGERTFLRVASRMHRRGQAGQGFAEYGIILMVVAIVVIAVLSQIGKQTGTATCSVNAGFNNTVICNNLLTQNQASIETDATGWANGTGATEVRSNAYSYDGSSSLALSTSSAGTIYTVVNNPYGAAVQPGTTYLASAWVRGTVVRSGNITIRWLQSDHATVITTLIGAATPDSTTGWSAISVIGVAPAGAAYGAPEIDFASTGLGETQYIDHVGLLAVGPNLLSATDASFEDGTVGNWPGYIYQATTSNSTTVAHDGTHALKVTQTVNGNAQVNSTRPAALANQANVVGVVWIYTLQAKQFGINVESFSNGGATYIGSGAGGVLSIPANTWTLLVSPPTTLMATATNTDIAISTGGGTGSAGDVFYVDQAGINGNGATTWSAGYTVP